MSDHLTELGHKQEVLKQEISRLARHSARIHGLTEEERSSRLLELNDELALLRAEIEKEAQARQEANIARVYGTHKQPASEGAKAAYAKAQAELDKALSGFEATCAGYAKRVREAQLKLFEAAEKSGQPIRRPDMVLSGVALKLGALVGHAVKHG